MRGFIKVIEKLKWVGLLGFPIFISEHFIWKMLWLFCLFAILELLLKLPITIQAIEQLLSMLIIPIIDKPMPSVENYRGKIEYSLPLKGNWVVVNGGVTKAFSHSWSINSQRYAYDFIKLDENGKSYSGDQMNLNSYYSYNQEILAPADGLVIKVYNSQKDSVIMKKHGVDPLAKHLAGNYIIIKHDNDEYSFLAHLKQNSMTIKENETVKRGQKIALCGNSGNTTEPHLHFQIQNRKSFIFSSGIPICFKDLKVMDTINYNIYDGRVLPQEENVHKNCRYIHRGQTVANR